MATNVTVDCTDVTIVTAGQQGPQGPAGPTGPLDTLSDVTITSVVDGQVLTYDSGSGEWVNETPSGGSVALNDLTDVTITGPIADNELLAFDFGSNLWINQTNTEAAVADRVHTHVEADITDLGAYVEAGDSITWTGANTFTGVFNVGDPGFESGSVLVNGASFPAVAKVNRFGSAAEAELILHRHSTTDGSHFLFSRALSNDATHADVINGTSLGDIVCTGWHTNSYWLGGIIRGSVDGTPTLGGMPTRLDFFTSAVGSASPTLRMSVRADGTIDVVGDINMGTNLITDTKVGQWDTAFSWGDHSTEGYLKNVLEDTTPQLGGNLDRNGNEIVGYTVSRALQTSIAGAIEVSAVTSTELGYSSGVTSAIQTQINSKIGASGVTYENLDANGDVGTGATQVSQGDHIHDGRYYTETEVDANTYSRTQLDAGQLDTRYYTETEIDATFQKKAESSWTHAGDVDTTSGTSHSFTGLPTWPTEFKFVLQGVSSSGAANILVQVYDSVAEATYSHAQKTRIANGVTPTVVGLAGAGIMSYFVNLAGSNVSGHGSLMRSEDDNASWVGVGNAGASTPYAFLTSGRATMANGPLEEIKFSVASGSFDNGAISLYYR